MRFMLFNGVRKVQWLVLRIACLPLGLRTETEEAYLKTKYKPLRGFAKVQS